MQTITFDYKASITGKLEGKNKEEVEIVVPLKHLKIFWRILDMHLINCETNLILTWSKNCVIKSKAIRNAIPAQGGNPAAAAVNNSTNATF